jgi:hypothetical protein
VLVFKAWPAICEEKRRIYQLEVVIGDARKRETLLPHVDWVWFGVTETSNSEGSWRHVIKSPWCCFAIGAYAAAI